jgi:GTP-binding protein Era
VLSEAAELGIADDIFPVSAGRAAACPSCASTWAGSSRRARSTSRRGPLGPGGEHDAGRARARAGAAAPFQEIPHAVEVVIDDIGEPRDGLVHVRARIWVETDSQKGILIGKHGKMIKLVGTAARGALELQLGSKVHLDLRVDVRRRWRTDERLLDRLGIE